MGTLKVIGSALYQWEIGRKIRIDASVGNRAVEVQFAHPGDKEALSVIPKEENGVIVAEVPNIMLQSGDKLIVFLVEMDENCVETTRHSVFHVVNRPKPGDYVYTETDVLNYRSLVSRIDQIEQNGVSDEQIAKAVGKYLDENPIDTGATEEEAAQIEQNKQDIENLANEKLDAEKLPEAINEALTQAKESGEFKGDPGYTPLKGTDYFTPAEVQAIAEQAANLVEVPEGGTVTDEQIASAVEDYMAEHPVAGGNADQRTAVNTYKTEDIGELYVAPADYTAWCPGNLRWDKALGKFVSLIYAAPAHVHTTSELYVTYIDPDSFVATDSVKCKYVDTDGMTDITPANAGCCSFLILSDGTYLMIHEASDGKTYKFTSEDNGITWKKASAVTGFSGSPWNMTELSNGRILVSDDASKVGLYYSDDKGVNWTQVIPKTVSGGYEAEAFIVEVEPGKLIAIARYSMSGKGYYESGDSEAAVFACSDDYGTNWSNWQISSIDNMNASSCTGIVHDGIVEIFAASRWCSNGGNVNTDNANTGKNGAIIHYMATAENALKDNFTRVGIIDYAKGAGDEYHSPCASVDDKGRMLIVHMDGGESVTCNNRYIRGELGGINYKCTEDGKSAVKAYSAKHTQSLFDVVNADIAYIKYVLSTFDGSGVEPPTGTLVWTKTFDASTATDCIHRDTESDFYAYTTCTSYADNATIQMIGDDTLKDNEPTMQTFNYSISVPVEKENCAIYVHGRTGRIDGNMGSPAHSITLIVYMDNVEYKYIYAGVANADYAELQMEYINGKPTFTKDGLEVSPNSVTELTSDSENYGVNKCIIGATNNNYCCYRTIKFGEWDSE